MNGINYVSPAPMKDLTARFPTGSFITGQLVTRNKASIPLR
jgi:hypothetical protein